MKTQPAVFFDRDGTLNEDTGYPAHISQVHIYPCAFEAVRKARSAGFATVVISSQSGVGRGFFTEAAVAALHGAYTAIFGSAGAGLDAIYYCPHFTPLPSSASAPGCDCAKPGPGLAFKAAAELGLDLKRSYMIGDKADDIDFGRRIGAVPVLVLTGYGPAASRELAVRGLPPAYAAETVLEAVDWILERERRAVHQRKG